MFTQVILRMGKWLHQAMYTHYLSFFKTEGLLAMGGWPHAQNKDFSHFWHERFEMDIPASMLSLVSVMLQCVLTSKPTMQVPKDGYIFTTYQKGLKIQNHSQHTECACFH